MKTLNRTRFFVPVLGAALLSLAVGCGDDGDDPDPQTPHGDSSDGSSRLVTRPMRVIPAPRIRSMTNRTSL